MRVPDRRPTAVEWIAFAVALIVGIGVAAYFGNLIAAIGVGLALLIAGIGLTYSRR
ncbi:hypothetical protein [Nocardia otitidiscaviarum]|uniref:hypothetical protein n=1 Tax=Nocardia otitidiscaviarum TaxID=1823 RepID=UPI00163D536A|nr:hypothetical protein [Nocardia otitidiscaviarum]MBF6182771.1 hypothetical protein [Nocardia otitidiscaviarum]MCP9625445.1 hypothetical protein [Nocardia otitidiscaviarum]